MTELYEALEGSPLRVLPLMLLQLNQFELAIADKARAAGVVDPEVDYILASRALADRNYAEAVRHLENALRLDPQSVELAQYRIFALLQAGEVEAARLAVDGVSGFWE